MLKYMVEKAKAKVDLYKKVITEVRDVIYNDPSFEDGKLIGQTKFNGTSMALVHNDFVSAIYGYLSMPFAMVAKHNGQYMIVVNTKWQETNRETKEAILAHEIGHVVNGDSDYLANMPKYKRYAYQILSKKEQLQKEMAADLVAVNNGHGQGLKKVLEQHLWYARNYSCNTDMLIHRLEAINIAIAKREKEMFALKANWFTRKFNKGSNTIKL